MASPLDRERNFHRGGGKGARESPRETIRTGGADDLMCCSCDVDVSEAHREVEVEVAESVAEDHRPRRVKLWFSTNGAIQPWNPHLPQYDRPNAASEGQRR